MTIFQLLKYHLRRKTTKSYLKYLRKKGIEIGDNCIFRHPESTNIDVTRPTLVTIGNNVDFNRNFILLSHDYTTSVFLNLYGNFVNSSGTVRIGNNVYFGVNCTLLKGAIIGDNCIIGANSLVTGRIPNNSVAVGVPAKVICSIDEYYQKRKQKAIYEAVEYAQSIRTKLKREPNQYDFFEEFGLFVNKDNYNEQLHPFVKKQMGIHFDNWIKSHSSQFPDFNAFLVESNRPHNNITI